MWDFARIPVSKALVDLPGKLAVIVGDFARILKSLVVFSGELMLVMFALGAFLYMLIWITADDPAFASTSAELGRCQAQMSILKLELDLERQKATSRSAVNAVDPDVVAENVKKATAEVKLAEDRRFACRLKNLKCLKDILATFYSSYIPLPRHSDVTYNAVAAFYYQRFLILDGIEHIEWYLNTTTTTATTTTVYDDITGDGAVIKNLKAIIRNTQDEIKDEDSYQNYARKCKESISVLETILKSREQRSTTNIWINRNTYLVEKIQRFTGGGFCRYADGNSYDGDWRKDKKHGRGILRWANGVRYEGSFDNNTPKKGRLLWANPKPDPPELEVEFFRPFCWRPATPNSYSNFEWNVRLKRLNGEEYRPAKNSYEVYYGDTDQIKFNVQDGTFV